MMLGSRREVQITLADTVVIQSRLLRRKRLARVPVEVRRAGAQAICHYLAFRTRQPERDSPPFIIEHIEVATR